MSVNGVLCTAVSTASQRAAPSEAIRRRCSTGTGLRFCGMIELICTKASGTCRCPTSNPVQVLQVLHEAPSVDEQELERRIHAGGIVGGGDAAVGIFLHARRNPAARPCAARSSPKPDVVIAAAPMLHRSTVRARVQQAVHVAQRQLDERGEIVAVGRRLRRLAVRIGDDDGFALALGDGEQGLDQREDARRAAPSSRSLSASLNTRVVDVVAAAPGMELAGDFDAQPADELALDVEEEVLVLARVDEAVEVDGLEDIVERAEDGASLRRSSAARIRRAARRSPG